LDHPVGEERSGLVYVKESSHVITNIFKENGIITGLFRILNSPNGRILNDVLSSGVSIG
jgi:hypothetical protein